MGGLLTVKEGSVLSVPFNNRLGRVVTIEMTKTRWPLILCEVQVFKSMDFTLQVSDNAFDSGWSDSRISNGTVHGMFASDVPFISKTWPLEAHSMVQVKARYWAVDSWDRGEYGSMVVNGVTRWSKAHQYSTCGRGGWSSYKGDDIPEPWCQSHTGYSFQSQNAISNSQDSAWQVGNNGEMQVLALPGQTILIGKYYGRGAKIADCVGCTSCAAIQATGYMFTFTFANDKVSIYRMHTHNGQKCNCGWHIKLQIRCASNTETSVPDALKRQRVFWRGGLNRRGTISFEDPEKPGYYLREQNYRISVQKNDGSAQFQNEASFYYRSPLGESGRRRRRGTTFSFESYLNRGKYITQRDTALYVAEVLDSGSPAWRLGLSKGSHTSTDIGETKFNQLFWGSSHYIVKRLCSSCANDYKEMYYRRYTSGTTFAVYDYMKENWKSLDNQLHVDFDIFSTYADAMTMRNAWQFCNYDDTGIGFPRDCGKTRGVGNQWNSWTRGGKDVAYYVAGSSPPACLVLIVNCISGDFIEASAAMILEPTDGTPVGQKSASYFDLKRGSYEIFKGRAAYNLDTGYLQYRSGGRFTLGQQYTMAQWIYWRTSDRGWRTLFRGNVDHAIIVKYNSKELGFHSTRNGGWRGSGWNIETDGWYFVVATGKGTSPTSSEGVTTFYSAPEGSTNLSQVGNTVDRVACGTKLFYIGMNGQGPGRLGKSWYFNRILSTGELQALAAGHGASVPRDPLTADETKALGLPWKTTIAEANFKRGTVRWVQCKGQVCYYDIDVAFPHYQNEISLTFGSSINGRINDESWAVSNVTIHSDGILVNHSTINELWVAGQGLSGIKGEYFQISVDQLPNFGALPPSYTAVVGDINFPG